MSTHPLLYDDDDDEVEEDVTGGFRSHYGFKEFKEHTINPNLCLSKAEGGEGMFEEDEEPKEFQESDIYENTDAHLIHADNLHDALGHNTGENIEEPQLSGVGGQQVYPQTAY